MKVIAQNKELETIATVDADRLEITMDGNIYVVYKTDDDYLCILKITTPASPERESRSMSVTPDAANSIYIR